MQTCYLLNFNNYYNREFKRLLNINDYLDYMKYSWTNVNFNPGDGITTTIPVNYDGEVNYLVLTDNAVPGMVGVEVIVSRWFIIESKFTRMGQRVLTLRRDVLVDYSTMATATVYAERGYVPNTNNLIFNSEGNSYNQIKKKESILKDGSASPWLVGYLASNVFADGDKTIEVQTDANAYYDNTYATTDAMIADNPHTTLNPSTVLLDPIVDEMSFFAAVPTTNLMNLWRFKYEFQYIDLLRDQPLSDPPPRISITNGNEAKATMRLTELLIGDAPKRAIADYISIDHNDEILTTEQMLDLLSRENKIARVGNPVTGYQYYKLIISPSGYTNKGYTVTSGNTKIYLDNKVYPIITEGIATGSVPDKYGVSLTASSYTVSWQLMDISKLTITLKQTAPPVEKSPYYCFAIPYNSIAIQKGALITNTSASSSRQLARQIATQLSSFCYDVQLMPYFPLQSYISSTATVDITDMSTEQYSLLTQSNSEGLKSILFWINEPNFSFKIEDSIVYNSQEPKVQNETQFCRLNSPNYAASFEFSVAKNKGVSYWQVDCSYKPYQPYIHVAPNWKGLYGSNFNDARGLICTGDFSIDLMTDRWQEYQVQNKNYNEIFNRQIQSLDLQQSIAKRQEIFGAVAGSLSGAMSGATTGALAGGLPGAIAGGVTGLGISAVGGVMDVIDSQKLRDDARSSQFDMFNYQLGNVKALPNTLTKVSTYNINNKIYPFYEIYEATSEEIEALRQQLNWRGYNLGIIGQLSDFQVEGKYFKGKLIRLEEVHDVSLGDNHLLENYNSELQQGIYWTKL